MQQRIISLLVALCTWTLSHRHRFNRGQFWEHAPCADGVHHTHIILARCRCGAATILPQPNDRVLDMAAIERLFADGEQVFVQPSSLAV